MQRWFFIWMPFKGFERLIIICTTPFRSRIEIHMSSHGLSTLHVLPYWRPYYRPYIVPPPFLSPPKSTLRRGPDRKWQCFQRRRTYVIVTVDQPCDLTIVRNTPLFLVYVRGTHVWLPSGVANAESIIIIKTAASARIKFTRRRQYFDGFNHDVLIIIFSRVYSIALKSHRRRIRYQNTL